MDSAGLVRSAGNGGAAVTATSGSAADTVEVEVAQVVAAVAVSPASPPFHGALGDTLRLGAEAFDANGHPVEGAAFSWASGDESVAAVDSAGLVRSAGNGGAAVTATSGSAADTVEVEVAQVVAAVAVSPASLHFTALGDTLRLGAEAFDANGHPVEGAAFSWASGDESVAAVDSAGLVRSAGNGGAAVTATSGSAADTVEVEVAQVVAAVAVSPVGDTLVEGETRELAATASDANGHAVAGVFFLWTTSDSAVAAVNESGLATAMGAGEAQVTATVDGVRGHSKLLVVAPVPTAVEITPDSVEFLAAGDTARFTAEVLDQIGRPMQEEAIEWESRNVTVVRMDTTGLATAVRIGITTVMARAGRRVGASHRSVQFPGHGDGVARCGDAGPKRLAVAGRCRPG